MYRPYPPMPHNTDRVSRHRPYGGVRGSVGYSDSGAYHRILEGIAHADHDQAILPFWLEAKDLHAAGQLSEAEFTQIRLSAEWILMQMAGREPTFEMPEGLSQVQGVAGVGRRHYGHHAAGVGRAVPHPYHPPAPAKTLVCRHCNARNGLGAKACHNCGASFAPGRFAPKPHHSSGHQKACKKCKQYSASAAAYCTHCGQSFASAGPSVRGTFKKKSMKRRHSGHKKATRRRISKKH